MLRYGLDLRPDDVFWPTGDPGWGYGLVLLHARAGPGRAGGLAGGDARRRSSAWRRCAAGVTNLATTPTVLREPDGARRSGGRRSGVRVRAISSCGEPLNAEVVGFFREPGASPMDQYGSSEFGLPIGNHNGIGWRSSRARWACRRPGHAWRWWTTTGHELAPDVVGCIAQTHPEEPLFAWLLERRGGTASAVPRRLDDCAGDLARRDADGYFWFEGRADDVIKSAGYRIGPFEVESAMLKHPAVAEAAVVGEPDALRGQIVKAFVVTRPGIGRSRRLEDEIVDVVKTRLRPPPVPAGDRVPRRFPRPRPARSSASCCGSVP